MHEYIDTDGQIIIENFPRDVVPDISRLQSQYTNTTFDDQSRYILTVSESSVQKRGASNQLSQNISEW